MSLTTYYRGLEIHIGVFGDILSHLARPALLRSLIFGTVHSIALSRTVPCKELLIT